MIDLEKEFGSLLDTIVDHLDSEEVLHYGVKGMKWGVRKERTPAPELKSLGPQSITRKTASGDEITISQNPPTALHKFLGRHSQKYREDYAKGAFFTIKDKDGKTVGESIVEKRSKDELYLLWLNINKSERGKGYATAVMKAAAEFGEKEGFKKLTLEVPGKAADARHIYETIGFKITKETTSTKDIWGGLTEMEYVFANNKVKHSDASRLELVVVAIPREDDRVWKISSEKVPHMTLLYLGELDLENESLAHIVQYIEHASSQLSRFGMHVNRRGKLGDQEADVIFFDKDFSYKELDTFRGHLLKDREIYEAYHSTPQFPEWLPHLTLGYPDAPAKPDDRDYPIGWVEFDRIAIWTGDSEGPTFRLNSNDRMELAMTTIPQGSDLVDVLEHYGVKGMKWGQRKKRTRQTEPNSDDANRVGAVKTRVKTQKTTSILTTAELKDAIERMRLEQDFSKLSGGIDKTRTQKTKAFVAKLLIDTGKQTAQSAVQTQAKSIVDEQLRKARV